MRLRAGLLWIAFAALIAYLSFVPFRFQPLGFDEALARFAQIRYLDLGAGSRADWVANILMFVPLGWLAAAFFVPHPRRRFDAAAVLPSLILGSVWAVAVEFGQVYFAGRTVSVNDIVAEVIGTLLGAWLWSAFGKRGRDWWQALLRGGHVTANAVLGGYLLAYLVLSFSPFDFVISTDELALKASSNLYGWWLAPVSCGPTPCSVKLLVETVAVMPFGWWLAARRHGGGLLGAALLGALLGLLIELAQFLLVSGTSQGASVIARAAGVALGAWLHSARHRLKAIDWVRWGQPLVLAALAPYLAVVAYVAGWFSDRWLGLEGGLARAGQIQWMPFFFQYFSTEQALIRSTLVHLFLYAPVGVGVWLWGRRTGSSSAWIAAALAAALAFLAESSKLFVLGKHPDYTDVLIAVAAAWTAATLLRWSSATTIVAASTRVGAPLASGPSSVSGTRAFPESGMDPRLDKGGTADMEAAGVARAGVAVPTWPVRLVGAAALLIVAVSLLRFPVWQLPLGIGLVAYAVLLKRWPLAYLVVLPMALPVLDLAPLSGRFYWDEFDFLLATTVGVRLLTTLPPARIAVRLPKVALTLLALSVVASTAIALWPPPPLDANTFASYLSPYNALRVAKGYLWGGALLWLFWRDVAARRVAASKLQIGLGLGLLAATLGVFWERLAFVGPADVGAWFRAAGLVSATHTGGAYLEVMLVALTPFALAQAVGSRRPAIGALWFGVALGGAAAVLMTLSRAAAGAWLLSVAVFVALWWFAPRRRRQGRGNAYARWATLAVTFALVGAAALMAQSTSLRDRVAASGEDFPIRLAHWRLALDLMRNDPLHLAFGMGVGSFPREFYLAEVGSRQLPAYRLEREAGHGFAYLSLRGGRGMYIDQRVDVAQGRQLVLRGKLRSSRDGDSVSVALCEKSFLTSVRCDWASVESTTDWQPFEVRLAVPEAAEKGQWLRAPVSFSLYNGAFGTRVDLTSLSLLDGSANLLANGSFDAGLDRWFMYSDQHLAWRVKNTPLQVLFEQGGLGVLAWLALAVGVIGGAVRRIGELPVAAAIAATAGFVAVGCFDTLLDAPRLTVLVALVIALAAIRTDMR